MEVVHNIRQDSQREPLCRNELDPKDREEKEAIM